MTAVFADTSALYAVLDRDDAAYRRAGPRWVELVEAAERIVTTNYVVVETAALVQHRLGLGALRTLLDAVLPVIEVEWVTREDHGKAAAAVVLAGRRRLSLVDCVSFEVMRRLGISRVFAFDAHFRQAGLELV